VSGEAATEADARAPGATALGEGRGRTIVCGLDRMGLRVTLAMLRLDGMAAEGLESSGTIRVLAVRDGDGERWTPSHPRTLGAEQDLLLACSLDGWQKARELGGAGQGS
jgi:hypothetical protein